MKKLNEPTELLGQAKNIFEFFKGNNVPPPCDDCVLHDPMNGLLESFRIYVNQREREYKLGNISSFTFGKDNSVYRSLMRFVYEEYRKEDVPLTMIDKEFLVRYNTWLYECYQIAKTSINNYMYALRIFLRTLYDQGMIRTRPFATIKIKKYKSGLVYLSEPEISAIRNFKSDKVELEETRDIFLFMYNTGLAHADYIALTQDNLYEHMNYTVLSGNRAKTRVEYLIPLSFEAKYLIEKYRNDQRVLSSGALLPAYDTLYLNRYLKRIAKQVGITKSLSTHVARHSFATSALLYGMPITSIQKVLGHSTINSTLMYANLVDLKVCSDMDNFNVGVIKQMSKSYTEQDQLGARMKIEMSLDDQSWLAIQLAKSSLTHEDCNNPSCNDEISQDAETEKGEHFNKLTELALLQLLDKNEYRLFSYFRLCKENSALIPIEKTGEIQFSIVQIKQDIGGAHQIIKQLVYQLEQKNVIRLNKLEKKKKGYYVKIMNCEHIVKAALPQLEAVFNQQELERFSKESIQLMHADKELRLIRSSLSNQYTLLFLLRVLAIENRVMHSRNTLANFFNTSRTNCLNCLKTMASKRYIQLELDGSKSYRIYIDLTKISIKKLTKKP